MDKCINLSTLLGFLFDREKQVQKAEEIMTALLEAGSARLSMIAEMMPGLPAANYKTINAQATSRNQEHFRAFADIKALLGNGRWCWIGNSVFWNCCMPRWLKRFISSFA